MGRNYFKTVASTGNPVDFADLDMWDDGVGEATPKPNKGTAERPKVSPKEKKMSNKFLPFVVESSTPLSIFNTIISRSKGLNNVLVTSVFNMVLNNDIKELRAEAKKLPDMSLEKMYEALLIHYGKWRVEDRMLAIFYGFPKYLEDSGHKSYHEDLLKFSHADVMSFFLPLAMKDPKALSLYTEMRFGEVITRYDEAMNDVQKFVNFADAGHSMYFDSENDLRSFILYRAFLVPDKHLLPVTVRFHPNETP